MLKQASWHSFLNHTLWGNSNHSHNVNIPNLCVSDRSSQQLFEFMGRAHVYHSTIMPLQLGQQPPQKSGPQPFTLSAIEKSEAVVDTRHFINVILHGMGHYFRVTTQWEEDIKVPARRSRAGGHCRADGVNTACWGRLGREHSLWSHFSRKGTLLKLGQVGWPFMIVLFLSSSELTQLPLLCSPQRSVPHPYFLQMTACSLYRAPATYELEPRDLTT